MTFQDENIAPNTFLEIEIVNTYQNMCLTTKTEGRLPFFMSCCNSDVIRCNPVATCDQRMENMDTMPTVVEVDKYFDLFEPVDFGLLP
jgi:hypothetical protein